MNNLLIGSHVSFNKETQYLGAVKESLLNGANCFMFYTGPNASSRRYDLDDGLILEGLKLLKENHMEPSNAFIHAPFILNFANDSDERKYNFYISFLKAEIERAKQLGVENIIFHPGASTTLSKSDALDNVSSALNIVLRNNNSVNLLIEFMSGKGTEVGTSIDELKIIIDKLENKERIGVCIDTCHMNDSGVDISKFDEFLDEFDEKIGIDKIKCVHVNDSLNEVGAHKDRHANIGYGTIGFDSLMGVVYSERLSSIPKILETPRVNGSYKLEIECIKSKKFIDFINQ